jgi:signal transduction histidine kinase
MRLLTKTTIFFFAALVPLVVAAGFFVYNSFIKELNERLDQELVTEEIQWVRYLQSQAETGITFILRTPELMVAPVDAQPTKYPSIQTTTGYDQQEKRTETFRQLTHVVRVNSTVYLITIRKSQEQRTALVANITRILLLVIVVLFIFTVLINWLINQSIWKPFRRSLQKIRTADLQKMEAIHFEENNIKEFNELNASLNEMSSKIYSDYLNMKEFTENAAHEMQTPVAVAQGKLELLLQDPQLDAKQVEYIVQASDALTRLSKLNQSLLLLAKIDNHQYDTHEAVSLSRVSNKYISLFEGHINTKQLTVEIDVREDWMLNIHPFLADSLLSNLIGNAIKYNFTKGIIRITIQQGYFKISNTSKQGAINEQEIFKRFSRKKEYADNSSGLGLAIVKKICDTHNLHIHYHEADGMHHFIFKQK